MFQAKVVETIKATMFFNNVSS